MSFRAPTDECLFVMTHGGRFAEGREAGIYPDVDDALAASLLNEAGRFAETVLAPLNRAGDRQGVRFEQGEVRTPAGWRDAYAQWRDCGWNGLYASTAHGGMALPHVLYAACLDLWNAANMPFMLAPILTFGAIDALSQHASAELKNIWLGKLVTGKRAATMALTEPQAGSDLSTVRTRAEKADDGSYRITGQKIFISYGEHDLTDNIVHLVLARLPGAPDGTRGISLFLVPKYLPASGEHLGERNDVRCVGVEQKLGLHASPTCTMAFGDAGDGATGWLIGEENRGLACMFTMMNAARLAVGLQGVGIGERAFQHAHAFAMGRRQGRAGGMPSAAPIIQHPDVRRMLLTMKALTQASRVICYMPAGWIDRAHRLADPAARAAAAARAGLLTPVAKAFATDAAIETASLGIQVHGGMGYVEETGAAQYLRDARITSIYEGTNGIQAIDLLTRKLPAANGEAMEAELADMRAIVADARAAQAGGFAGLAIALDDAVSALERAARALARLLEETPASALAGAGPFLRLFALARGGTGLARLALSASEIGSARAGHTELAVFFAENMACQAAGLEHMIIRGGASVVAGDAALGIV